MSQVLELLTLQTIDAEVAAFRAALAEAERRIATDDALDEARARLATAAEALSLTRAEQRRVEAEIAGLTARITPEDRRLYDGSVKNPKELASIQHEVELLKAARSKLEDDLLVVLSRLEAETAEHETCAADAAAHERRRGEELIALQSEVTRVAVSMAEAEGRSNVQRTKLPPTSLRTYDDVRRRKSGVAVARMTGTNCGACRVSLPDAIRRRAMISEIPAQCPNCDRILCPG
jgi:predicted  nucleic acid-binding Zn-ribbon protein